MTYLNRRILYYDYVVADGIGDAASRVASLIDSDGTSHLVDYSYLGLGVFVETKYPQPSTNYTMIGTAGGDDPDTGDIYRGFDRFTRIKDLLWYNSATSTDSERVKYGYDRVGNRTYRQNTVDPTASHDEVYTDDAVHRLKDMQRGTLDGSMTGVTNKTFAQCWSLDATGNWQGFREDSNGDGTWDLVQARTDNPANEITLISNSVGSAWATPTYDRAGNMNAIPQSASPANAYAAKYDAWNRLVSLDDGANPVLRCQYDGLMRRTARSNYSGGVLAEARDFFYSANWQSLEEWTSLNFNRQVVYGLRYIDDVVVRDRVATQRHYALQDANWNVTAIVSPTGPVFERYAYAAYGGSLPTYLSASFGPRGGSLVDWNLLYCGYRWETIGTLYHVRNRMYSPLLGAWVQHDPFEAMDYNLYSYVVNNPLVYTDAFGLVRSQHHWIPQDLLDDFTKYCDNKGFDIHDLTTWVEGINARGSEHHWLTNTYRYTQKVRELISRL